MPSLPTSSESNFLVKTKRDLTDNFKKKDEVTRLERMKNGLNRMLIITKIRIKLVLEILKSVIHQRKVGAKR